MPHEAGRAARCSPLYHASRSFTLVLSVPCVLLQHRKPAKVPRADADAAALQRIEKAKMLQRMKSAPGVSNPPPHGATAANAGPGVHNAGMKRKSPLPPGGSAGHHGGPPSSQLGISAPPKMIKTSDNPNVHSGAPAHMNSPRHSQSSMHTSSPMHAAQNQRPVSHVHHHPVGGPGSSAAPPHAHPHSHLTQQQPTQGQMGGHGMPGASPSPQLPRPQGALVRPWNAYCSRCWCRACICDGCSSNHLGDAVVCVAICTVNIVERLQQMANTDPVLRKRFTDAMQSNCTPDQRDRVLRQLWHEKQEHQRQMSSQYSNRPAMTSTGMHHAAASRPGVPSQAVSAAGPSHVSHLTHHQTSGGAPVQYGSHASHVPVSAGMGGHRPGSMVQLPQRSHSAAPSAVSQSASMPHHSSAMAMHGGQSMGVMAGQSSSAMNGLVGRPAQASMVTRPPAPGVPASQVVATSVAPGGYHPHSQLRPPPPGQPPSQLHQPPQ